MAAALAKAHEDRGGRSLTILTDTRQVTVPHSEGIYVDYRRQCPREWFTRRELFTDFVLARFGASRPYLGRLYRPAIEATAELQPSLTLLYEGYYALPSLPSWRRALGERRVVLYAHNAFSRSYSEGELRRSLRHADGVACVSSALQRALLCRLPDPPCPVEVVPNGVDTAIFSPEGRCPRRSTDPLRVLFAGAVSPHKGVDRLLAAVNAAILKSALRIRVTVLGSAAYDATDQLSPYENHLRQLASDLQLDVQFIPFVAQHELPRFYREADVLCVPSLFEEPYALVIQEAMACGTPVIASGRGGTKEAGGRWATYVDPDDTDGFAEELVRLARDPEGVADRVRGARRWAEQHSWAAAMEQLLRLGQPGEGGGRPRSPRPE